MNIAEYIESGILESYVLGAASEEEVKELLYYKELYPQVKSALHELEIDMERIAQQMAIAPPPGAWQKIEESINEIIPVPEYEPLKLSNGTGYSGSNSSDRGSQFIDIDSQNTHMRVHKTWKWVFIAVFALSKIFLACAIYFYLENRQAQQQIQELKSELKTHHTPY